MEQNPIMPLEIETFYQSMMVKLMQSAKKENVDKLIWAEKCISIVREALEKLRVYISENPFSSETEEIAFFKQVKSRFYSQFIYYLKIYNIEICKPAGSAEAVEQYFKNELNTIQRFYESNREFYHYFRSGATYADSFYFLSGKEQAGIPISPHHFDLDLRFTSPYDYKVAKILANEMLKAYLEDEIAGLKKKPSTESSESPFKANTTLSVAQLGCFLRLFNEEKVFIHPNQTELINFFASHFATSRQENISGASLRSKYYNIDPSASEGVKDLLFQLINRLKKL